MNRLRYPPCRKEMKSMMSLRKRWRIHFICYDHNLPRGGQRDTYRSVDALNGAGFEADVVHFDRDFRVSWFANSTKVTSLKSLLGSYSADHDLIVVPEDFGPRTLWIPGNKVIFNKSLFYGFESIAYADPKYDPYLDSDVIAILGVSEHNCAHLRFAYPTKPVFRVFAGVREDLFVYSPLSNKLPQIAYMQKSELQMRSLYRILRARAAQGLSNGGSFSWIPLRNRSEEEAATLLNSSYLFLFANIEEGLPQVLLETGMSGCLALTYRCAPLDEIIPEANSVCVNDLVGFCEKIEQAMSEYGHVSPSLQGRADLFHRNVEDFTLARQYARTVEVWDDILTLLA